MRMSLRALEGQTVHWPYEHINASRYSSFRSSIATDVSNSPSDRSSSGVGGNVTRHQRRRAIAFVNCALSGKAT